jgi:hypothetical protein
MKTTADLATDTAFDRALVEAYAAFDRARAEANRALFARGGRYSTHAAAIVTAYANFDRARAEAHANYARARA